MKNGVRVGRSCGPAAFQAPTPSASASAFCLVQKSPSNLPLAQSSPAPSPPGRHAVPRVRKNKGWLGSMCFSPDWRVLSIMWGAGAQVVRRWEPPRSGRTGWVLCPLGIPFPSWNLLLFLCGEDGKWRLSCLWGRGPVGNGQRGWARPVSQRCSCFPSTPGPLWDWEQWTRGQDCTV